MAALVGANGGEPCMNSRLNRMDWASVESSGWRERVID